MPSGSRTDVSHTSPFKALILPYIMTSVVWPTTVFHVAVWGFHSGLLFKHQHWRSTGVPGNKDKAGCIRSWIPKVRLPQWIEPWWVNSQTWQEENGAGELHLESKKEEAPLYNKDCVNQSWIRLKVLCFFIINSFESQNKVICLNENKKYKFFFISGVIKRIQWYIRTFKQEENKISS